MQLVEKGGLPHSELVGQSGCVNLGEHVTADVLEYFDVSEEQLRQTAVDDGLQEHVLI